MPIDAPKVSPKVEVKTTRTVTVPGVDGRPALELSCEGGEVKVALLPRNGQRRAPVRMVDLSEAVRQLAP